MRSLLLAVLAAYVVSAIHAVLAFLNKRRSLQRVSEWAMAIGFVLHTAALIVDWAIFGHYPLFYLRETLFLLAWTLVASYALVLYRYRARPLGVVTLPLVSLLIFIAVITRSATPDQAEANALWATWLSPVHIALLLSAYAAFFVVFLASIMYLLQERELKLKTFSAIFHRLPSLTMVNEIATSSAAIGLTLLTVGIATGMVWASEGDFCGPHVAALLVINPLPFNFRLARTQGRLDGRNWICFGTDHISRRPAHGGLSRFRLTQRS
jgi:ABC-type transport system involved in cytochrome c biogenesis permease subunit